MNLIETIYELDKEIDEKYVNKQVTGMPSNEFEERVIKNYDPKFYKTRVSKRKTPRDKNGLPKEPYVWMPRSA